MEQVYPEKQILPIFYEIRFNSPLDMVEIQKLLKLNLLFTDILVDNQIIGDDFHIDKNSHRIILAPKYPFRYVDYEDWIADFKRIPPLIIEIEKRVKGEVFGITVKKQDFGTYYLTYNGFKIKEEKNKEFVIGEMDKIQDFLDLFQELRISMK
ncbi:hypothetical protein M9Y10_000747 [Tritrichomonas musculus]|uniref:Uncharacterized protein n=1 Tax=Tritrichomonas musculus TaxID=1915356 RepID=A0ABR2H2L1_9EUKA